MSNTALLKQNPLLGITYMFIGTLFFATADATGKWLTADYPVIQIGWIRSCTGLVMISLYALFTNRLHELKTKRPGAHLFRGIMSAGALFFIFYGLKHIPIAEYVSLTFAAPFITALLSPLVLKEKVSLHSWIAIGLGFVGILIVLRPTPGHFHLAHVAALSVALSIAILSITARHLARTETATSLNFYIYPVNIIVGAYWAIDTWVPPTALDWFLHITLGVTATSALIFFIQALRYAMPAVVSPMDYFRMLWMISLGYLVWGEVPAPITWLGIIIIIASGVYVVTSGKKLPELEMAKDTSTGGL
jgi:drug/metabolite transporter (DMT)-like permease